MAMALAPHWLDEVIGDLRDPQKIIAAIAESPKFKHIVKVAVDKAALVEDSREELESEGHHIVGSAINQVIRTAIVDGVSDAQGHVPND